MCEIKIGILRRTDRSMMRATCEAQLKDGERSMDLMLMLDRMNP